MTGENNNTDTLENTSLVSAEWLENNLDNPDIKIIEVDEKPELYSEAHIPGAIGFDWQIDLQDSVRRDFLGKEDFAELLSQNGISNDDTIVLYGDRNNWFAAYTFWYLKYYGHDDVRLMNGPREKWIADGKPTTTETPSYEKTEYVVDDERDSIRIRRDELQETVERNMDESVAEHTKLIDVRSPQEYSGERIAMKGYENEGAQRGGHIPTAESIPWATAVQEDGTFKSVDELREIYNPNGPVITYCRIGERSAHTWFVLTEILGHKDVRNYDGSWTEWGNLVGVPIEVGNLTN